MRRTLVVAVAVGLLAAACTNGSDESASSTTTASPSSSTTTVPTTTTTPPDGFGGEVRIGVESAVTTLNPFAEDAFPGTRLVGNLVWALVYDIDPDTWERVPDTVVSMPSTSDGITVNDDGTMTVTYEVRSGATWSDGTQITGEDVAFTAEALRDLAVRGRGGVDPVMATVVETDHADRSASITFERPSLAFEDALWIILPSATLSGLDLVTGTDGSDWPSGGPFVVDSFDVGEARFVRNDAYWKTDSDGRGLPYLDAVTVTGASQSGLEADGPNSPADGFVTKEFDVAKLPPVPGDLASVESATDEGAVVQAVPTPIIEHITFQFGSGRESVNAESQNDQLAYRQAVAHAIDREGLLDETGVPWIPQTPGMLLPRGPSAWSAYPYDPQAGADLVAGLESGSPVQARLSTTGNGDYRIRIGDALESRFGAIGVEYEPVYLDSVLFFGETLFEGAFDLGMWAWNSDGGYAGTIQLMGVFDPSGSPPEANFGRWEPGSEAADRFAEIVESVGTTVDPAGFWSLVDEAERILADELILIPLAARSSVAAHWSDAVSGVVHNGSPSDLTWNIERWQRMGE